MDRTDEAQGRTGAALMLVVLGAVLLTTGVLALQGAASEESGAFLRNDRTMLWAVLLCVQSALWAVLGTSHVAFRRVGLELRDRLQPFPSAGAQPWEQWYADRKALESLLELNLSNSRALQTGLAIATPILGSAFGLLLGIGT